MRGGAETIKPWANGWVGIHVYETSSVLVRGKRSMVALWLRSTLGEVQPLFSRRFPAIRSRGKTGRIDFVAWSSGGSVKIS